MLLDPSVRYVVPALILGKPVMVSHAAPFEYTEYPLRARLKWAASWLASHTLPAHAPGQSIARGIPIRHICFQNPYNDLLFRNLDILRSGHLLYVGRPSAVKGVDTLLRSIKLLKDNGTSVGLTVVGAGSKRNDLMDLAEVLGIAPMITWRDQMFGELVGKEMNRHRLLVVPSRWKEPFSIVALEGLACGCQVVVSRHGGLMEAAGRWGYRSKSATLCR